MIRFSSVILTPLIALALASCSRGESLSVPEDELQAPYSVIASKPSTPAAPIDAGAVEGTIEEALSIDITFPVAARVARVHVKKGDYVREGQLVAEADSSSFIMALSQAQAEEQKAAEYVASVQKKVQNGMADKTQLMTAEATLRMAKNKTLMAKRDLENCKLYAPIDGSISEVKLRRGQLCSANSPLATLDQINKVYAVTTLPISMVNDVAANQKISVTAKGGKKYAGRVMQRNTAPNQREFEVRILIENPTLTLKPGTPVTIAFPSPQIAKSK